MSLRPAAQSRAPVFDWVLPPSPPTGVAGEKRASTSDGVKQFAFRGTNDFNKGVLLRHAMGKDVRLSKFKQGKEPYVQRLIPNPPTPYQAGEAIREVGNSYTVRLSVDDASPESQSVVLRVNGTMFGMFAEVDFRDFPAKNPDSEGKGAVLASWSFPDATPFTLMMEQVCEDLRSM
jgi:hypothetical protein